MLGLTLPAPDWNEPQQVRPAGMPMMPAPTGFEPDPHVCLCRRRSAWPCPVHPAVGFSEAMARIEAQQRQVMMILPPSVSLVP